MVVITKEILAKDKNMEMVYFLLILTNKIQILILVNL